MEASRVYDRKVQASIHLSTGSDVRSSHMFSSNVRDCKDDVNAHSELRRLGRQGLLSSLEIFTVRADRWKFIMVQDMDPREKRQQPVHEISEVSSDSFLKNND